MKAGAADGGTGRHPVLRRIARNASWVLAAQILSALLGLASLAFAARALGPAGLGMLAAAQAYGWILNRLLHLEPWQSVLRFGVEAQEAGQQQRFLRLVKFSLLADLAGGGLAGCAALAAAPAAAGWLRLGPEGGSYLMLLALALFLNLRPTGLAVLRVLDRFDLLAKADVAVAAVRLGLCAAAWAAGLGLWGFLLIALLEGLASGLAAFVLALRQLRRSGHGSLRQLPLAGLRRENPGLLRLLWNSNINVILRQSVQRLDVILLTALAGPAAAGSFHLARRLGEAAQKLGRPLNQAVYPEFARKWAAGDAAGLRRLALGLCGAVAASGLLLLALLAPVMAPLLTRLFGAEFAAAAPVVCVQMAAAALLLTGMMLGNALLSCGRDSWLVRMSLAASALFLAALAVLVPMAGPLGAALAHLVLGLALTAGNGWLLLRPLPPRGGAEAAP
ncbi:oligosaccharide flippase family protein (plasmid) [Leisingera sp. S132]|uniref:lipopolysaccharide biosynthesis protein n=1 Tax=Leisingera sp. S132 TaxID=2867016 RepID=UPI0021A89BA5|nr:oligosaccharide flippase family protein [Leisingera sp. S132]UWQ81891.1 oligosaccharide flippase family protein [Leisingera sp. S132]